MGITSTEMEAQRRAANDQTVEFVRLGYAGASLNFRTQVDDLGTFRRCMDVIGGYNRFSGTAAAKAVGDLFPQLARVEVGRESSPVLYLYLPFYAQQRIGSREGSVPIPEQKREALRARIHRTGKALHADEIDDLDRDGKPYCVRLWWD